MEQLTLFGGPETQPLAARLRPQSLDEFVGQAHLLGEGKALRRLIESDQISSMIFWGPPGVGKRPSYLWMRSIGLIRLSRMRSCPLWRKAASF